MQNCIKQQQVFTHYDELISARIKMQGDQSHHLEIVCTHNGIDWVNHSMATNIDMTWHVLRDVPNSVVLIIGGIDRSEDQKKLKQLVKEKVHAVICLGSTPWKYFNAYSDSVKLIVHARNMREAIHHAIVLSDSSVKTILFSPSCSSYDAFDNYKNRGNLFRQLVKQTLQIEE